MARIIDIYPDIETQQILDSITYSDDGTILTIKKTSFLKNIYFYICFRFFSFCYDFKPVIG